MATPAKYSHIDFIPTDTMADNATKGLEWRAEFGRGGTAVGVARARDLKNKKELSPSTVKRMFSYFSRHEVDKQGQGWSSSEEGFPSAGRIAWELWGGDAGFSWSRQRVNQMKAADAKRTYYTRKIQDIPGLKEIDYSTVVPCCDNCWFFQGYNVCTKYKAHVNHDWVCDSHTEKPDIIAPDPSSCLMIDLKDNDIVLEIQDVIRPRMGDLEIEWTNPEDYHITLLYADFLLEVPVQLNLEKIPISTGQLEIWPLEEDYAALVLRVQTTPELLMLQEQCYQFALTSPDYSPELISPYSIPADWKPHITLGYIFYYPTTVSTPVETEYEIENGAIEISQSVTIQENKYELPLLRPMTFSIQRLKLASESLEEDTYVFLRSIQQLKWSK